MPAQKKQKTQTSTQRRNGIERREPEKNLFSWQAPGRPFKRRDRDFWIKVLAIVGICSFILYIIEGIVPVILGISLLFLFYILSTVEPDVIKYQITNKGVKIADKRNDWRLISRFWFSSRFNNDLLVFETLVLPGRLELVINKKDKAALRKVLVNYLPEEEAPPTGLDKTADWFSKKLPGK